MDDYNMQQNGVDGNEEMDGMYSMPMDMDETFMYQEYHMPYGRSNPMTPTAPDNGMSAYLENGNTPVPPIAPDNGMPAYPGNNNIPTPPIAPDNGLPVYPGNNTPTPPIAPDNGFPVYPGNNTPTPPIAPDNGFPVYPGNNTPTPPIAPDNGFPVYPGDNIPVPPIAPDNGFPVYPGDNIPTPPIAPGNGIPAAPGPIIPGNGVSQVRVLNAANSGPVSVVIGTKVVAGSLEYGTTTGYSTITDGFKTVTVTSINNPRRIIYRQVLPFVSGTRITLAIINTVKGVDIVEVSDVGCVNRNRSLGCFRVVNLSNNSGPIDVVLNDGRIVFSDVRFKEVTNFKRARPGRYAFDILSTPNRPVPIIINVDVINDIPSYNPGNSRPLLSFSVDIRQNIMYTAYIIGNDGYIPALQVLILENR